MHSNTDQQPTVLPLICDGIAITLDVPQKMQKHIISNLQDFDRTAKKGRYRHAGVVALNNQYLPRWADRTGQSELLIQCEPLDPSYRFLRCEFNPSKIDLCEASQYIDLWQPANLYNRLITEGIVTKFDVAIDVGHVSLENLVPYPSGFRITELKCRSGRTIYAGILEGWRIYDKKSQIIELNQRKSPVLHDPVPKYPVTRFEYRLKPKRPLKDVAVGINNPFNRLAVVSISNFRQLEDSDLWRAFAALAHISSVNNALAQLTDETTKKRYRNMIRKNVVKWWKPDTFWAQLDDVIDELVNPVGQNHIPSN